MAVDIGQLDISSEYFDEDFDDDRFVYERGYETDSFVDTSDSGGKNFNTCEFY